MVGLFGARALAGQFECDTSSALEWHGLFLCVASVIRVSFYGSLLYQNPKKNIKLRKPKDLELSGSVWSQAPSMANCQMRQVRRDEELEDELEDDDVDDDDDV